MIIDKNTVIYGSFSSNPGSQGSRRFNNAFEKNGINAIYKSFKVDKIEDAFAAAKILNFGGFTISMPFKNDAIQYCSLVEALAKELKSVNTVVLNQNKNFVGYNSDYYGVRALLSKYNLSGFDEAIIIGLGAYARTASYVLNKLGISTFFMSSRSEFLHRDLKKFKNKIIFNASPLQHIIAATGLDKDINNLFIDCDVNSSSGKQMSYYQARHQFYEIFKFSQQYIFEEVV